MKTPHDPRHLKRISIMQELFAYNFSDKNKPKSELTRKVLDQSDKLDKWVSQAAPMWPTDKINKIDLAILRLAVYELMISKEAPVKVVVDEAVELAKEYGSESSPSFINGALGKLIEDNKLA